MIETTGRLHFVRPLALALALTGIAAGCSDDGSTDPDPDFAVSVLSAAPATTLGTETSFQIRLTSTDFDGPVTLAVGDVPAGWAVALDETAVDLSDGDAVTVGGTVTIASDAVAAPSGYDVEISASGSPGTHTVAVEVTVADEYVLPIAAGTASGTHWPGHLAAPLQLRVGSTLRVRNDDAIPHRVHPDGMIPGFAHQESSMMTGQSYTAVVGGTGTDGIYCHDHGHEDHVAIHVD